MLCLRTDRCNPSVFGCPVPVQVRTNEQTYRETYRETYRGGVRLPFDSPRRRARLAEDAPARNAFWTGRARPNPGTACAVLRRLITQRDMAAYRSRDVVPCCQHWSFESVLLVIPVDLKRATYNLKFRYFRGWQLKSFLWSRNWRGPCLW